ncbi:MAG: GAF domain-containing protein [Solirubrobacterales bacterium]|nr:GAF domain-containing protein [Solirubrobacterales bacterium]
MSGTGHTVQSTEPLDTMVELLSGLDAAGDGGDGGRQAFYDRLCEAMCRLTSMERAGLLLYQEARRLVVPAGTHGFGSDLIHDVHGTLDETPIAQRALAENRVVEVSGDLAGQVPARYAQLPGITKITCTPVSAGGRWLGVIFADRGGEPFDLTDRERHTMWTLGKTAALAASARIAATQHERARLLAERVDLAREVHERVMQRLFGVSLVLGSEASLTAEQRQRCADEIQAAVADLRHALARPVAPPQLDTGATLREELQRLGASYDGPPLQIAWDDGVEVPRQVEQLSQSVLAEALRNAHKHAEPTRVDVRVTTQDGTFVLEVVNDGVESGRRGRGAGMGLRLAALDALQSGGVVDFGPTGGDGEWRVRLVVPLAAEDAR